MKEKEKLQKLIDDYNNIEIPDELEYIVMDSIGKKKRNNKFKKVISIAASLAIVFVGSVNIIPSFADTLEDVPVLGNIVKVVRLSNYSINRNGFDVSIDVPKLEGLKDKELEKELNEELEREAKDLYNEYLKEIKELEKDNIPGREMVQSWYEVLTDNDKIFSMVVYNHYAQGSSNTTRKIYNIDKKNETAITLKSLFKDKDYISVISENIKAQMIEQMKSDPDKVYWINSETPDIDFKEIKADQGFYINDNNEIVICFDKYEVAPGAMGLVEFAIPKTVIDIEKNI